MSMTINMPLGDLIDKSPKGEARFAHEEWLRTLVVKCTFAKKSHCLTIRKAMGFFIF